jgi:hypothetical protein
VKISSSPRITTTIEWCFLFLGFVFCLFQLALSWHTPILDEYAFRQTQTAISVYWIMKGGAWLAYSTPVLGAPWSIPFEFPLYQWIVAIVAEHLHFLTLDQAGRVVSEAFFLMCLWPLWRITTHHENGRSLFRICGSLLLFSPIYIFWSRSFMMESTTLFFSIWFVASLSDYVRRPNVYCFIEMSLTGSIAACLKITTFVGFSFAGALIVLWVMYAERKNIHKLKHILSYVSVALAVVISIAVLAAWVHYIDLVKSENAFGQMFTAAALKTWNFGTLQQRESKVFWHVIFGRAPNEAIGAWRLLVIVTALALFQLTRRQILIFLALLSLYIAPFFVFTNLHLIHHYYQYANSIFLVFSIAYVIAALVQKHPSLGLVTLACVVALEIYGYKKYFYDDMMQPNRQSASLLSSYIRSNVNPAQMIVGFGLTWSSEVPYYAERRALLVPDNTTASILARLNSDLPRYTDGVSIGAVVVCPNKLSYASSTQLAYEELLGTLTENKKPRIVGFCKVYVDSP